MSFHDFEEDLQAAQDPEKAGDLFEREHLTPFGDIVEELSWWDSFTEKPAEPARRTPAPGLGLPGFSQGESYVNPFRHIGRNDPCPCGSGKKFKKCCLAKVEAGGLPG